SISSFFSHAPAPTAIYTLSLHDALPISRSLRSGRCRPGRAAVRGVADEHVLVVDPVTAVDPAAHDLVRGACASGCAVGDVDAGRSEEHTSELQSRSDLVCRLLLEKKKIT